MEVFFELTCAFSSMSDKARSAECLTESQRRTLAAVVEAFLPSFSDPESAIQASSSEMFIKNGQHTRANGKRAHARGQLDGYPRLLNPPAYIATADSYARTHEHARKPAHVRVWTRTCVDARTHSTHTNCTDGRASVFLAQPTVACASARRK